MVFNYTGAVVEYTIPTTGSYYVAAVGAQRGDAFSAGGCGAGVGGSVLLDAGTELDIVVGGAGMFNLINLFKAEEAAAVSYGIPRRFPCSCSPSLSPRPGP
jgi:hypothetical protein